MVFLASLSHRSSICGKTNTAFPKHFIFQQFVTVAVDRYEFILTLHFYSVVNTWEPFNLQDNNLSYGVQGARRIVQSRWKWGKRLGQSLYPSNPFLPTDPHWGRKWWAILQPAQPPAVGERRGAGRTLNHFPGALCQYQLSHSQTGLPR